MENLNKIVAENMVYYRKTAKFTQAELAEKLNYSDKAVSKWERGESLPDLAILVELAEIYGITVNDLLATKRADASKGFSLKSTLKNKKVLITLLSCCAVWIVATFVFVLCGLLDFYVSDSWKAFIYAIPATFLVAFIFSCIWGRLGLRVVLLSITMWGIFLSLYLSFTIENLWLIFIIAIPIQLAFIMWYLLERQILKIKWHSRQNGEHQKKVAQEIDIEDE